MSDLIPDDSEVPAATWDPMTQEELRQLEARARARMADPEYRRRIEATDVWARRLLEGDL